jgi:hypothetical protein
MPRQPRIDAPITLHYGMVRGSERTALFRGDANRTDLATRNSGDTTRILARCPAGRYRGL